jgi:hypothetical protein
VDRDRIEAALAALHADVVALRTTPPVSVVTVGELADKYTGSIEFRRLAAIATNRGHVARIVNLLGARDAGTLGMRDVDELRAAMPDHGPRRSDHEPDAPATESTRGQAG